MGGCGALSAKQRMYIAPFASWTAVRDDIVKHMECRDFEDVLSQAPSVSQQLSALHACIVQQGTLPSMEYASPVRALATDRSQSQLASCIH